MLILYTVSCLASILYTNNSVSQQSCLILLFLQSIHIHRLLLAYNPRGLDLSNKAQRLFPSDKFMGVFFSGSRQVNALKGVCGSDGVKRVACRYLLADVITTS